MPERESVAAIVAAAGQSTRMGTAKQLLPWRDSTVIATVVANLVQAGADPIIVAVGHRADDVEAALAGTGATVVKNTQYERSEMLRSYQVGLRALLAGTYTGALLALGDQPHIPVSVLRQIVDAARQRPERIAIPSYDMRRGHPIFLPYVLWDEVLALGDAETLRVVMDRHADSICYVSVDTPAVLRDMDTPSDYDALRPS